MGRAEEPEARAAEPGLEGRRSRWAGVRVQEDRRPWAAEAEGSGQGSTPAEYGVPSPPLTCPCRAWAPAVFALARGQHKVGTGIVHKGFGCHPWCPGPQ